jgi:hypothetical protein
MFCNNFTSSPLSPDLYGAFCNVVLSGDDTGVDEAATVAAGDALESGFVVGMGSSFEDVEGKTASVLWGVSVMAGEDCSDCPPALQPHKNSDKVNIHKARPRLNDIMSVIL